MKHDRIEAVAKAIWDSQQIRTLVSRPVESNAPSRFYPVPWEALDEERRIKYRDDARAAILAYEGA